MFRWFTYNKERRDSVQSEDFRDALVRLENLLMQAKSLFENGQAFFHGADQSILKSEMRGQRLTSQAIEALVHVRLGRGDVRQGEEQALAHLVLFIQEDEWQALLKQEKKALEARLNHLHAVAMGVERHVLKCHHDLDLAQVSRGLPRRFGRDLGGSLGDRHILTDQHAVLERLVLDVRQDLSKAQALLTSLVRVEDAQKTGVRSQGMLDELKRQVHWETPLPVASPSGFLQKRLS